MAQNVTQRFPFSNKGVVQKIDINQLQDGQYSFLLNAVSEQEGALAPRYGYQPIDVSDWDGHEPSVITSMLSVRPNAYSLPTLYAVSTSSDLLRLSFSTKTAATAKFIGDGGVSNARIGIAQYGTNQSSDTSTVYFATGSKMLRDKSYNNARVWGINPPYWPAEFVPGKTDIKDMTSGVTWDATPKVSTTISSVSVAATGTSYYKITPASLDGITVGSFVYINTTNVGFVDKTDASSFYGYLNTAPSVGQTVIVQQYALQTNPTPMDIASITGTISTNDISLSGKAEDGYNSDDTVHFSFYTSTPSSIYDVRLRLFTNSSTSAYYEKSIIPSPAQGIQDSSSSATAQQRADSAADSYSKQVQTGVYSAPTQTEYDPLTGLPSSQAPYDNISSGLTPAVINPGIDGATSADGYWTEINISKKDFLQVGGAGSGVNTWKDITNFEVIVRPTTTATSYNFRIGSIYAYGNVGLNSNQASTLTPYDYIYTYKDPESGAESNPSVITDSSQYLYLTKQGIDVVVRGTDKTSGRQGGSGEGITKVCIYRRGGAFTDGLYRRVGIIDNPGVTGGTPNTTVFHDTTDDISIISAPIAEFDNFAPVTSDLNQEYVTTVSGVGGSYSGDVTLQITLPSGVSDLASILTPGSIITIGNNVAGATGNQEDCVVNVVISPDSVGVYTRYVHQDNEQVTWSSVANKPCDLVLSAFNRMWVAGDSNNPNVLYSSKTSRPESFPVINEATGNAHQIAVSSPGDPINGIAEFNGEIVCLCQNSIYTVRLDAGKLVGPFKTPSNRGLSQKYCWGYVDNAIWFLSNDGIYAWAGGQIRKMSFAIDFIFNNIQVNDIPYFDYSSFSDYKKLLNIQQKGNEVFCNYLSSDGYMYILRYNIIFDRWSIDEVYNQNSTEQSSRSVTINGSPQYLKVASPTCMYQDRSTLDLFTSLTYEDVGPTYHVNLVYYNESGVYTDGGEPIYYEGRTKFYDMGSIAQKKTFSDIALEFTPGASISETDNCFNYSVYYDYDSNPDSLDANKYIPYTTNARQVLEFPLQQSSGSSAGKEARSVMYKVYGQSSSRNILHSMNFNVIPLAETIKGRVTDWDDLGHPFDKRLFNLTIEYDNNNTELVLYLDTIGGLNSASTTLAAQTITLPAKSGRAKSSIPITADIVAKMVRLRPQVATTDYQIFNYSLQKEDYPRDIINNTDWSDLGHPYEKRLYQLYINCDTSGNDVSVAIEADGSATPLQTVTVNGSSGDRMQAIPLNKDLIGKLIRLKVTSLPSNTKFQLFDFKFDYEKLPQPTVLSTPWTDFGYDYLKYAEQISFDVNTNNQPVPVGIYGDGTLMQTVTVKGTQANRNQIITLNPALTFRTMRLEVGTVPTNGRFQLWDYRPIFKPADKGEVYHTFDWDDLQYPYDKKLTEVTIEFETGASDDVKIALDTLSGLDGTTLTSAFQTLTLPNTSGSRGFKTFAINETVCKMIRIRAIGSGNPTTSVLPSSFKMYGYKFGNVIQYPADIVKFTDWSDLGYQYEKRFYQLYTNCDTNGYDVLVNIEADGNSFGISSIASYGGYIRINSSTNHQLSNGDNVYIKDVTGTGSTNVNGTWVVTVISPTAFMLNNSVFTGSPAGGTGYKILQQVTINTTATNRMVSFALNKDLIGKLVRLNVVNVPAGGKFQLFDFKFDYENLPKPIILSTPWTDFGYDYIKYAEQLTFDVNTNGVQIPVDIYCDGVWKERILVSGTQQARNFNCTLNPAIVFQTMRLQVNPEQIPDGGRFQLWEYKPIFRPADKGEVYHTFDWDNLDHPYDKKISEVTIEFETGGKDVVVALDTLTGINGNTENLAVQTFTLNSTGRGYKTFPIPETICKMVRIRSLSTNGRANRLDAAFKMWGYKFGNTVPYPPDIQKFSEWTDLDYPCDKIFRGVGLTIDTGGVDCTVVLEVDGVAKQTFTVNTTTSTRQTFLTAQNNTEIIGKLFRLTFTPGSGGKAQVFGAPQFNTVKDSCPFVFLDSYEQGLGSAGYSVLKQFWADYKCEGSITIKFYNEYNVLFYSETLGPHASRDVERFYLPSINGSVINKSKKHRITIEAVDPTKPFKWYRDTSRLEYINLSSDQRQGYFQFIPWTNMQLPV